MSASHHYLNENFTTVARAAVRTRLPHYARNTSSHDGTTRRFSNLVLDLPLPYLMATVQLPLGISSQTTRDLVPRPHQMTCFLASSPPTHLISKPAWNPLLLLNHSLFAPLLMDLRVFSATSLQATAAWCGWASAFYFWHKSRRRSVSSKFMMAH